LSFGAANLDVGCYDVVVGSTPHNCEDIAKSRWLPRRRLMLHVRIRRLRRYGADPG
jgi:hypothetical protein